MPVEIPQRQQLLQGRNRLFGLMPPQERETAIDCYYTEHGITQGRHNSAGLPSFGEKRQSGRQPQN
ncbi:hypothetical protein RO575_15870 [Methylomonas sp. MO1]|uniref:hypothetical protein n=1 Tax=Methylomonas sp. MO1 TaxID=3073619 RepID=UPI0028A493EF|nr:hypothetical protein [Methylomonas sp. MO1]MDT4291045.1 hypothetical protein [Methylomonas sp. MO1]